MRGWALRSEPAEAVRQRLHRRTVALLAGRVLDEAQLRVHFRHRAGQHHPRHARVGQHPRTGAAAGETADELRERRRRLLDVAHAVGIGLAQLGAAGGVGHGILQATEGIDQATFLGLRTAPHAATGHFSA
ncbi:hypothetical protein G6F68_017730 [Rhizopus microsporus]|nr:hypothetical protein G6F68_017730 [Rhizopus microsporus]